MGRISDARERLMEATTGLIWGNSYGSTTVDDICAKAEVRKGSFYYFFKSKSDLAVAALDITWQRQQAKMDGIFSATVPPLERFKNYFEMVYQRQTELKKANGRVLGCPLFSLGSEVSTQDQEIRGKVEEILRAYIKYFESAVRDAQAQGVIQALDPEFKAKCLFAYFQGVLGQARILNDAEILRELPIGAQEILGGGSRSIAA